MQTHPGAGSGHCIDHGSTGDPPIPPGAMGSRIAQMMLVDCLFVGVAQQSYEASIDALRKTHAVVQSRKLRRGGN